MSLPVLARRTAAAGIAGFEWAVGVPGSIGGAVRMNAGGHGSDMAACVADVEVFDLDDPSRGVTTLAVEQLGLRFRASALAPLAVVLGADTVVVVRGELLGKPHTTDEARTMLEKLSGRAHEVITGVALVGPGGRKSLAHETTVVHFRELSPEEISDYAACGDPLDKAGAYAIQGRASRFVTRIEGCYFNVMGLPVALVDRMLRQWKD